MMTLAVEIAALPAIIQTISAITAVASTALTISQAQKTNQRADEAERLAREKAARERIASNAKAAQERSLIARKLATQVDSARVIAGAAGLSGGTSQLVLESSFAADARADLATVSANQARGQVAIDANLDNSLNQIGAGRINPFTAAVGGVAQGIGMFTTMSDGLTRLIGQPKTPEGTFAGSSINPAAGNDSAVNPLGPGIDIPNAQRQIVV